MTRALRVAVVAAWAGTADWYNLLEFPAACNCEQ
jgi:hypothetical protein